MKSRIISKLNPVERALNITKIPTLYFPKRVDCTKLMVSALTGILISSLILMTNFFYVQGQQQPTIAGFIPRQQQQERVSSQPLATSNSVEQAESATVSARNLSPLSVSAAVLKNPLTIGDMQQIVIRVLDAKTKNPVQGATVNASLAEPVVFGVMKNMAMSSTHWYTNLTPDPTGTVSIDIKGPKVKMLESGPMTVKIGAHAPGYQPNSNTTSFELIKRNR